MASLPTVGASTDTWGTELNAFLLVAHDTDGTLLAPPGSLPDGWYDLTGTLTHGGTDNTAALQAVIDSIPSTGTAKSGAVFLWPVGNFTFNSKVSWAGKAIRNVGTGSTSYSAANVKTSISAGADSITMFECDGGAGEQFQCASFENLNFSANSHTSVTGLKLQRLLRGRVTDCTFDSFDVGIELDENAVDCAWHRFDRNTFRSCTTGIHSTSSNHCSAYGNDYINCTTGVQLAGTSNQWAFFGEDYGQGGNNKTGMLINGYSNSVFGSHFEMGNASNGNIGVSVVASSVGSTHGSGNYIEGVTLSGGAGATTTNIGINLDANTTDNRVGYAWQSGFSSSGGVILDSGLRNRINAGGLVTTAANRPSTFKVFKGVSHLASDTGNISFSDGTQWVVPTGAVTVVKKTADQTITSTTTLADLTSLSVTLGGDSTSKYFAEAYLLVAAANSTMDLKLGWTSGVSEINWAMLNGTVLTPTWGSVAVGTTGVLANAGSTTISVGTVSVGGGNLYLPVSCAAHIADNGSASSVFLRAAQDTSDGGNLIIKAGSFLRITRIV